MIWALWFGPIIGGLIVAIGVPTGLRIRSRRGTAIRRIAERLAWQDTVARGYEDQYDKYLQHYLGRQHWQDHEAHRGIKLMLWRWLGGPAKPADS